MKQHSTCRGDAGITMILFALTLVILMIFAAFAVDVSGVYSARRADQNGADASSLGGLQTLFASGMNDGQVEAKVVELARASVGDQVLSYDWNSCSLTDDDLVDTVVNGKSCITTTPGRDILQVKLPTQDYRGGFAKVAGVDLRHSAFAIAGVESIGLGGVLPLPMKNGAGGGDGYVCVRTGPGGALDSIPPCEKNDTGGFGNVDFELWREDCPNGTPKDIWAVNVARGVDHILSLYGSGKQPHGTTPRTDQDLCPGTVQQRPNAARTPSTNGVTPQTVADAFFNGLAGGTPGRLALNAGNELADNDRTTIGTTSVDNNGLWEFITPGLDSSTSNVPESCEEHNFIPGDSELPPALETYFASPGVSSVDRLRILLQRCVSHYNGANGGVFTAGIPGLADKGSCGVNRDQPCTGVVFGKDTDPTKAGYDIQFTPRFAYVPELDVSTPPGANTVYFHAFRAVFIQRVFAGQCSSSCSWSFEPNPISTPTPAYPADSKAAGVTVFVIPPSSLPGGLGDDEGAFALGVNLIPRLLR